MQAALTIAPSGVTDLTFPDVDPTLDEPAVRKLGSTLLQQIEALQPAAVLLQGEPILSFYLVSELERKGIPCYAASTERKTTETTDPDGVDRKVSVFEFVRFRRYGYQ
jgi:hypothetical protein